VSAEAAAVSTPATGGIWEDPAVVDLIESAPRDWRLLKLQDVCTRITDGTHRTPRYQPTGVRFISIKNIRPFLPVNWATYEKYISQDEHRALTKRCKPEFDDILFPRIGTLGFAKRIDFAEEVSIFVGLGLLKPNKSVVRPKYLEYWMNHPLVARLSRERATGSGRLTLPLEQSREFPVPVPPLTRQDEIVAEIEKQFSRLDEAVANLKCVAARLHTYRRVVLDEAFATEATTTIGALVLAGPQNGLYLPKSHYGEGTPILRIDDYQFNWSRPTGDLRRVRTSEEQVRTWGLKSGDLLINRVNSVSHLGKAMVVPPSMAGAVFESNLMRMRLIDGALPRFVELYLGSPTGRGRLTTNAKWAVNQASINQQDVCATPIPMLPYEEQHRIVAEVDRRLTIVREVERSTDANLKRADALRQAVLARAYQMSAAKEPSE